MTTQKLLNNPESESLAKQIVTGVEVIAAMTESEKTGRIVKIGQNSITEGSLPSRSVPVLET